MKPRRIHEIASGRLGAAVKDMWYVIQQTGKAPCGSEVQMLCNVAGISCDDMIRFLDVVADSWRETKTRDSVKQLSFFENQGYIPGYSPKDKEQREQHDNAGYSAEKLPVRALNSPGGVVVCRTGSEQAQRLIRLLSDGYSHSVVDIQRKLNIGDPRSVIRDIRNAGIEVCDRYEMSQGGNRYKLYWIKK